MNLPRFVLAALILCPPETWAQKGAEPNTGLAPGQAHEVTVSAYPTEGLEVGMPRDGWYARGIRLDRKGDWKASTLAYGKAMDEFKKMSRVRPGWEAVVDGWVLKARFQREQSSQLSRAALSPSRYRFSYSRYPIAMALHHKWLAIRAFTGRSDDALQKKIIYEYNQAVLGSRSNTRFHLALATFYQQAGMQQRGAREWSRVRPYRRRNYALEEAAYQAAVGDLDQAFAALKKAARSSHNRYIVQASNMLDPLRADPRFKRLVERAR